MLTTVDLCSGGGGELLGLEMAGNCSVAAIDNDPSSCATLRLNRPQLAVIEADLRTVDGTAFKGVDVVAGGVPCPPFSIAGKRLGAADERDLFPHALRFIRQSRPVAIMLENVPGFASTTFSDYRHTLLHSLSGLGYQAEWRIIQSSSFGVAQLRPRFVLIALLSRYFSRFQWPEDQTVSLFVSDIIGDLMGAEGWPGIDAWRARARVIAPTLVGGSKKHGGPDLGPTRAKRQWAALGIDGKGIGNTAPSPDFPKDGMPKLTLQMTSRLQAFPDDWHFAGGKTSAYRQIGNALPPPVACAMGKAIAAALHGRAARKRTYVMPPVQLHLLGD